MIRWDENMLNAAVAFKRKKKEISEHNIPVGILAEILMTGCVKDVNA